ncbi:unnamed protein product [Cylicocyclus nassatus]|uniref:Uncharacterized protein n=1 Tax=Cylicocyclus nassatus TaxID=53992 RepID=A0AA36DT94_CYLNA|nr:unnamed protein product [Cylicocyclus nassatus]CAJ0592397.1 unnamed protein product [Cylicocyclus nassatus]
MEPYLVILAPQEYAELKSETQQLTSHDKLLVGLMEDNYQMKQDNKVIKETLILWFEIVGKSQCFPLYYYEAADGRNHSVRSVAASQTSLSAAVEDNPVQTPETEYVRWDGVSD